MSHSSTVFPESPPRVRVFVGTPPGSPGATRRRPHHPHHPEGAGSSLVQHQPTTVASGIASATIASGAHNAAHRALAAVRDFAHDQMREGAQEVGQYTRLVLASAGQGTRRVEEQAMDNFVLNPLRSLPGSVEGDEGATGDASPSGPSQTDSGFADQDVRRGDPTNSTIIDIDAEEDVVMQGANRLVDRVQHVNTAALEEGLESVAADEGFSLSCVVSNLGRMVLTTCVQPLAIKLCGQERVDRISETVSRMIKKHPQKVGFLYGTAFTLIMHQVYPYLTS